MQGRKRVYRVAEKNLPFQKNPMVKWRKDGKRKVSDGPQQ